jgi:tRNA pseudouridine55 synthase
MNGFINLLKPAGMTSSDAVIQVRRLLERGTRVGHGGTLDPDAAGVLPICVGKATRLFDYIIDKKKTYVGELCLGVETDTYDASGRIESTSPVTADEIALKEVLPRFVGDIFQLPPAYSALKQGGVALYKKARRGEDVVLEPRMVHIDSVQLLKSLGKDRYLLKIECGKGVYIRSLMHDIGEALGCGGHMSFLLRSQSGYFSAEDSFSLDELKAMEDLSRALVPMDAPLAAFPAAEADAAYTKNIMDGQTVRFDWLNGPRPAPGQKVRLYAGKRFAGMGEAAEDGIRIDAMLLDRETI